MLNPSHIVTKYGDPRKNPPRPCPVCSWFMCICPTPKPGTLGYDFKKAYDAAHNPKLDAFAIFLGEWAAKLKKVVSR